MHILKNVKYDITELNVNDWINLVYTTRNWTTLNHAFSIRIKNIMNEHILKSIMYILPSRKGYNGNFWALPAIWRARNSFRDSYRAQLS